MSTTAGTIITNVRDKAPDGVYNSSGVAQPDSDGGLVRAQTLYRWLDSGVRVLAQAIGATVEDWIAVAQTAGQPNYVIPFGFLTVVDGFSNQWPLDTISLVESDTIWAATSRSQGQSLSGFYHVLTDHIEFGLWPVPDASDPATTLSVAISSPTSTATVQLASTTNFLSFGYIQIDAEILQYQQVVTGPTGVALITRGTCGTTAATHNQNAAVQHLGLWLKGTRTPATITSSTSIVELPPDVTMHLEKYLLSAFRQAENEYDEARKLEDDFEKAAAALKADPLRKLNMGRIAAFGEPKVGPLYGGGGGVVVS